MLFPIASRFRFSAALVFALCAVSSLAAPRTDNPRGRRIGPADASAPRALQFEALPLERSSQNHLLLRAYINGKPALLAVDSGAPLSLFDARRLRHFGLTPPPANSEVPTHLPINGRDNSVYIARTFQLGALTLVDEPLVAVDLSNSSEAASLSDEQPIDGVLGADVLFPTHAVLDCRAQMLVLKIDPHARGSAPGTDYRGFSPVPMQVSPGYNLYVDGTFNGRRAKLMVDTGAFTTLFHQPFVRKMKIPLRSSPFTTAGVNLKFGGVQIATISRFTVGSVNMRSKDVGVTDLRRFVHSGIVGNATPVVGLLGSEILRRHNGIIDFGTRTLYLKH